MVTFVAVIALAAALGVWDRHTRRHAAWSVSATARFCVSSGYPMVAVAAYFLAGFSSDADWSWAFGLGWALAAAAMFVTGYGALDRELRRQHSASLSIETITPDTAVQAPTAHN